VCCDLGSVCIDVLTHQNIGNSIKTVFLVHTIQQQHITDLLLSELSLAYLADIVMFKFRIQHSSIVLEFNALQLDEEQDNIASKHTWVHQIVL
jgi:hypothetical protein